MVFLSVVQESMELHAHIQGTVVLFVLALLVLLCVCQRLVHQSWHNQMVLSQTSLVLLSEWLWKR